jgi:DNA-binding NtrC family response regulator
MERFSALVLSRDGGVLRVIHRACEEYGVEAKIVGNIRDANELLKDQRFDLAVCDCDFPGANELAYLDPRSAWRGMVFALIGQGQSDATHGRRVHLTLSKPLTERLFSRGLRAAYTTMAHERRAAFRYPLDVAVAWA